MRFCYQLVQLEAKLDALKQEKHGLFSELKKVLHQENEMRQRAQMKEQKYVLCKLSSFTEVWQFKWHYLYFSKPSILFKLHVNFSWVGVYLIGLYSDRFMYENVW